MKPSSVFATATPFAIGALLLIAAVIFGACQAPVQVQTTGGGANVAPVADITPLVENYARAATTISYTTSSVTYEQELAALATFTTDFPLTGTRFTDCLADKCVITLDNARVTVTGTDTATVTGTLTRRGSADTTRSPYTAQATIDPLTGLITSYAISADGEGTAAP